MTEVILDTGLRIDKKKFKEFEPSRFFKDIDDLTSISTLNSAVTHRNYIDYLSLCWKKHYGAVISPTILWNMVLNNLAFTVNKFPDTYRKYFTDSDKKQEIMVQQGGNRIDPALLIANVSSKIPSDILENIFPDFSTNSEKSLLANYTAFLDMVSPYYNYSMFMCGIPKIKVEGTSADWRLFANNCDKIALLIPEFASYLNNVRSRILSISTEDCNFSEMFELERCGSGSQVEIAGWINDFFIETPRVRYADNYISCISKIDYHCYNDGKDYRLYAGLFTSKIDDGYLVPDFDNIYFQKK